MNTSDAVAIWRYRWLQPSETFIRDQADALTRWRAVRTGRWALPDPLVAPDIAPFKGTAIDRLRFRLIGPHAGASTFRREFEREGVRLIHAHFATEAGTVIPLAKRLGLPAIVTCHGYDVTTRAPTGAERGRARSHRQLIEGSRKIIAVSDFIRDRVLELGAPDDRVVVHRIGIRTDLELPQTDDERRGVLFAGRFVAKKGLLDVLKAYAALPAQLRAEHPLLIAGDGPEASAARSEAHSLGVEPHFLGWQDPASLRQLMARSRVFCAPSQTAPNGDSEGFGLVFLEAALAGSPSVAYHHGGVPEAVIDGETGLLVRERDVAALREALGTVLDDNGLAQRFGEAGRTRVLRDFDITKTTPQLESIYDEVARPRPESSSR